MRYHALIGFFDPPLFIPLYVSPGIKVQSFLLNGTKTLSKNIIILICLE